MAYKLVLNNLQNVAPGNVATLKAPAGTGAPTYDQIGFELGGGMTPAHIEYVRGKADGRIFLDEGTGTIINKRDDYRGIYTDASAVLLDFTERNARNGAQEQLVASVPGSLVKDLSFEIKIASGAPSGGTIKAMANYRPPTNNGWIRKILNTSTAFPAAGTDAAPNIIWLPTGDIGGKVKRIWLHESVAGTTSFVSLRVANNVVHEVTRARAEYSQKRNLLVPQTGVLVLDFVEDGNLGGMLDTQRAPQVELRVSNGAACTYTVYTEYLDPIGRL